MAINPPALSLVITPLTTSGGQAVMIKHFIKLK
jgi:hypothetical protein